MTDGDNHSSLIQLAINFSHTSFIVHARYEVIQLTNEKDIFVKSLIGATFTEHTVRPYGLSLS